MKLKTLVVDDEAPARKKLRHFLELDPEIEIIDECENGHEALESIQQHRPDLVFLDIQMPVLDGFAVLKRSSTQRPPAIVFVTAYDEYAVKAFEANATDYLLKPFTRKRFEDALEKAKQQIRQDLQLEKAVEAISLLEHLQKRTAYLQRLPVKTDRGIAFLHCHDIDWIESEDNYIVVHSGKRTHILRDSLTAIERTLDPSCFLRIHRRILVNVDRIQELHPNRHGSLVLQNGSVLPISRRLKQRVKRFLLEQGR